MPLSDELTAEINGSERAALDEDCAGPGRKVSRNGIDIEAIKDRLADYSVAVRSWGRCSKRKAQERQAVGLGACIV